VRAARQRAATPAAERAFACRLTVRDGDNFVTLEVAEIDRIEAAANYVRIHARGRMFVLRGTMAALEDRLDPRQFARIHRSTIVNVDRVREIRPAWHGDFDVVLADGKTLRSSRSYRGALLGR
jgi:two-component system, LytTR family, response regulator